MARRTSLFERIIDDYSSDSAMSARGDRTTVVNETPGVADVFEGDLRRLDFEDGFESDASYVTVDDEFDATMVGVRRDDDV